MGPGVLRAITGPRGPRGAETLAEKWRRLSRAEQIALGGTLMAALAGGGWLLSGAARSGGGGGGAIPPPAQEPKEPLDSTNKADFRIKETSELLELYNSSDAPKRAEIAEFCACRIHDVRDLLLDPTHVKDATEIMYFHYERITPGISHYADLTSCQTAQKSFLYSALVPNASFISSSLGPIELSASPTFAEHQFGTEKDKIEDHELDKLLPAAHHQSEIDGIDLDEFRPEETDGFAFDDILSEDEGVVSEQVTEQSADNRGDEGSDEKREAQVSDHAAEERSHSVIPINEDPSEPAEWNDELKRKKREQWDKERIIGALPDLTSAPNHSVYGHVSTWDVRRVTTMKGAFAHAQFEMSEHIADMSFWDTRRVVDMSDMFFEAHMFNGDITNWDTRNVTNMSKMFAGTTQFDQDIGQWDTSEVSDMSGMFAYAGAFNQNLSNWVVKRGVQHDDMFDGSSMETENTKHPKFNDTSRFGRARKVHAARRAYV